MHGGQDCLGERQQVINCKNYSCALGMKLALLCYFSFTGQALLKQCIVISSIAFVGISTDIGSKVQIIDDATQWCSEKCENLPLFLDTCTL